MQRQLLKLHAVWFVLMLALTGCDSQDAEHTVNMDITSNTTITEHRHDSVIDHIDFGFDLRNTPQEDAKQYLPFLKYLQGKTGYKFNLVFTPKHTSTSEQLGNGNVQLAAIGATAYIDARIRHGARILVRGLNTESKAEYRSAFIVLPDSKISSLSQFPGKRLAFGSEDSTQGHLIPRIVLHEHHLGLDDFKSYVYTGSHRNCANQLISRKADICALQDTMAKSLESGGLVKIIYFSDYYPSSGIAASKHLSEEQFTSIKKALLEFNPEKQKDLYHWDKTEMPKGFTEAVDHDYDALEKAMKDLGFIK